MQKKTVRWIATVTLAGGGVLTSAAAASAAAYHAPHVKASPATCAALANDVNNALTDLTKKLSPNSSDAAAAMTSAADLARLIGAAQALGCPAVSGASTPAVENQQPAAPAAPAANTAIPAANAVIPGDLNAIPGANMAMPGANAAIPAANVALPALNAVPAANTLAGALGAPAR